MLILLPPQSKVLHRQKGLNLYITLILPNHLVASVYDMALDLAEIFIHVNQVEVPEPLIVINASTEEFEIKKDGKLPITSVYPVSIYRDNSIVTTIIFDTVLQRDTEDTIILLGAGLPILPIYS